jgi:hypothetical protein
MHLYLNYAREHWAFPGENPPVGLNLCAEKDGAVAKYALKAFQTKCLPLSIELPFRRSGFSSRRSGEPESRSRFGAN